jgi:hypothetical protein
MLYSPTLSSELTTISGRPNSVGWRGIALGSTLAVLLSLLGSSAALGAQCSNEEIRQRQGSSTLPECRAWEMVSPSEKDGSAVSTTFGTVQSAPSGNAFVFASSGAFGDAPTSLGLGFYRSARTGHGWSTHSLEAPQSNFGTLLAQASYTFSPDLSKTFQVSRKALAAGAVEGQGNAYLADNLTGERTLVATSGDEGGFFNKFAFGTLTQRISATPDYEHVLFEVDAKLTADAPSPSEGEELYEFNEGRLTYAPALPDGLPPSGGAVYETPGGGTRQLLGDASGSYLRERGQTTAVSASQRTPPAGEPSETEVPFGTVVPAPASASADGSVLYLTSNVPMTDDASPVNEGHIYRYEVASGKLTAIVNNAAPVGVEEPHVLLVSADGTYVYFLAQGSLVPGAPVSSQEGKNINLYVWHGEPGESGRIQFIAQTQCQDSGATVEEGASAEVCVEAGGPVEYGISPNGEHLAFTSYSQLTSFENRNEALCPSNPLVLSAPGSCTAVYDYDYASGQLRCVSCGPPGVAPIGDSELHGGYGFASGVPQIGSYETRNVLDDGRVFFQSPDDLTPDASNGKTDIYEWLDDGQRFLLSSGTAGGNSYFADATPDGTNVFFITDEKLVSEDEHADSDVYDARVDGGLASQNTPRASVPECEGDECQGVLALPPAGTAQPLTQTSGNEPGPSAVGASFSVGKLSSRQLRNLARTGRISLSVRVSMPGTVTAVAESTLSKHAQVLARGSGYASRAGAISVTLRLSRAARRTLARGRTLRVELSIRFSRIQTVRRLELTVRSSRKGR